MIRSAFDGGRYPGRGETGESTAGGQRRLAQAASHPALAAPARHAEDGLEPFLPEIRPADWINPKFRHPYEMLIIGGGALGVAAAHHAAATGARVALATDDPLGLDILSDALPREILSRVAGQARQFRRGAAGPWPEARAGRLDFAAVARELFAARQTADARLAAMRLVERGIDVYFGPLAFLGPRQLKVAGQAIGFGRALLVPVPRTLVPAVEGLESLGYYTPETLGLLAELPRRWAIIGSSPAACELAQALCRLGCGVDLVVAGPRLLAGEEPAVSEILERQFATEGIQLHLGWNWLTAQRTGAAKGLVLERAGQRKKLLADEILIAGERGCELGWLLPDLAGLALAPAGDLARPAGVVTSDRLRTSNRRILAIGPELAGDVANRDSVAALARLAVHNALGWRPRSLERLTAPRWIRTDPPICRWGQPQPSSAHAASVAAPADGEQLASHIVSLPADCRAPGLLTLRVDRAQRRVVGATVTGSAAQELSAPLESLLAGQQQRGLLGALRRLGCPSGAPDGAIDRWLRQQFAEALL